jgi:hypothetical protein
MRGVERMSKLVKRLQQICENSSPPIGFKASTLQSNNQLLLIASLSQGKSGMASQLNLAEVDALLLHSGDLNDKAALQRIADGVGDTPWGVWLGTAVSLDMEELAEVGGDFVALDSSVASTALVHEDVAKILRVSPVNERYLLSALSELPVDVVLMDLGGQKADLTVADIMHCQWLSSLVDKPLMVAAEHELSDKEIRLMRDAGVSGIVIEISGEDGKGVISRQSQIIRDLPPRTKKRGESHVFLPPIEVESDED